MKLIDVDALNLDHEVEMADDWKTAHEIANHVKYAPTIDAVPVVRCKDCMYCSPVFAFCTYNGRCELVNYDDFCSWGKEYETAKV